MIVATLKTTASADSAQYFEDLAEHAHSALEGLENTPRVLPRVDDDGIMWPPSSPPKDIKALDDSYREFQKAKLWSWWNAFTLVNDHPEVCFLQPLRWDQGKFSPSHIENFRTSVRSCSRDPAKTIFVSPLSLLGKGDSPHALVLLLNTTAGTLETFDPNGVTGYATDSDPEGYSVRKLYGALTTTAHELGLKRVIQTGPPIQLIDELSTVEDASRTDFVGYCEAWIYYYIRVKLLNPSTDAATLNRKLVLSLEMGNDAVLGFINAQLGRATWFSGPTFFDKNMAYSWVIMRSMNLEGSSSRDLNDLEQSSRSQAETSMDDYMQYWYTMQNQSFMTEESDFYDISPYKSRPDKRFKNAAQERFQMLTRYKLLDDVAMTGMVGGRRKVPKRRTRKSTRSGSRRRRRSIRKSIRRSGRRSGR